MKVLITISMIAFSVLAFGQTTEEEFNYLTKGYKIQLESGLDMKKGYTFKDVGNWMLNYSSFERKVTFKYLFRDNESIPCATLMIFERTDTSYEEYICIPHYDSETDIWTKAYEYYKSATKEWTEASKAYAWGMFKMISYTASGK